MRRVVLGCAISLACAVPAAAHHGPGTFDLRSNVAYPVATLTGVDMINPHSWLYFEVKQPDGSVSKHRCEMRSVHTLRRSGWTEDLFPKGVQIAIEASPDRADPNSCYLQTITFANGSHMDRYGQYVKGVDGGVTEVRGPVVAVNTAQRAFRGANGKPNLAGDWAQEQRVMANPRGTGGGLVPLGQLTEIDRDRSTAAGGAAPARPAGGAGGPGAAPAGPRLYGGTALTPAGEAAAAAFKREDNPRFSCETTSILFDWTFDGAVNRIEQTDSTITLRYGQMGLVRTIHMNGAAGAANAAPSRAGYSVGRWDGDVLVVETTRFAPGVLNAP
ncbi:MAG TPA: DUF6152 family protein, partial [Gammaproteobacteria bacterium]|nr:DUF6152 family protein [Gammaproteobacteria bacterium]